MAGVLRLDNATARRLFLHVHGLSENPARPFRRADLPELIRSLGFVQVDSIRTVERAHHHILASRSTRYKPSWLPHHLEKERTLFEHWTHDAAVIPVEWYPYWQPRFDRHRAVLAARPHWQGRLGDDPKAVFEAVRRKIMDEGPVTTRDLGQEDDSGIGKGPGWWNWRPTKTALEFLWRTGELAVTGRRDFNKVYDLAERVIPEEHRLAEVSDADFVDFKCREALRRIAFGTPTDLARFWDSTSIAEAKAWAERAVEPGFGENAPPPVPVEVEGWDGELRPMLARPDIRGLLDTLPEPPPRVRILSPFDPMLRDRERANRLFGFDYRIEVFVPQAKRQYGYYVFPVLERDRMVGRIDMKAHRDKGWLEVKGLWWEPGVRSSKARQTRLEAEIDRWRAYVGLDEVRWAL